jgi:hypothetical protein
MDFARWRARSIRDWASGDNAELSILLIVYLGDYMVHRR